MYDRNAIKREQGKKNFSSVTFSNVLPSEKEVEVPTEIINMPYFYKHENRIINRMEALQFYIYFVLVEFFTRFFNTQINNSKTKGRP